ncbi:hypothetical protein JADG_009682 [Aureobasidium aubasidani]|nr:hypothetical protein JADG_009679 [Aureobasidium pullulans]KAG2169943.1 hypothetical protein JADG_009682 [Aureobasidium pullulans]
MNSVKNYTPSPKAISEELAHKVNPFDPMAENHDELIVECDGDSTVSSEWSFDMTPSRRMSPIPSASSLFDRTMGATNTMALYTTALLGYISFLPSSPVITLATPSLASQEDNSDLDDTIPNLVNIESAARNIRPVASSCTICGSPVVDSVIIRSPTLPSSPAVNSYPNSPNALFTLSDLKHCNPGYIQAHSTIYANDSTWRW